MIQVTSSKTWRGPIHQARPNVKLVKVPYLLPANWLAAAPCHRPGSSSSSGEGPAHARPPAHAAHVRSACCRAQRWLLAAHATRIWVIAWHIHLRIHAQIQLWSCIPHVQLQLHPLIRVMVLVCRFVLAGPYYNCKYSHQCSRIT